MKTDKVSSSTWIPSLVSQSLHPYPHGFGGAQSNCPIPSATVTPSGGDNKYHIHKLLTINIRRPLLECPLSITVFFLFLVVLDLHCCMLAFSHCGEQGLLFTGLHELLIMIAFLFVEHKL